MTLRLFHSLKNLVISTLATNFGDFNATTNSGDFNVNAKPK